MKIFEIPYKNALAFYEKMGNTGPSPAIETGRLFIDTCHDWITAQDGQLSRRLDIKTHFKVAV